MGPKKDDEDDEEEAVTFEMIPSDSPPLPLALLVMLWGMEFEAKMPLIFVPEENFETV